MLMKGDSLPPPPTQFSYLVQDVYIRNYLGVMEKESISFSRLDPVFFQSDSGGVWAVLCLPFVGIVYSGCRPLSLVLMSFFCLFFFMRLSTMDSTAVHAAVNDGQCGGQN